MVWRRRLARQLRVVTAAFAATIARRGSGVSRSGNQMRGAAGQSANGMRLLKAGQKCQRKAAASDPTLHDFAAKKHAN
jgi:hypothetical protein